MKNSTRLFRIAIVVAMLIVQLTAYSQNTADSLSRDKKIAKYLIEGLECKETLIQKNIKIAVLDSIVCLKDSVISIQNKQIGLKDTVIAKMQEQKSILAVENDKLKEENQNVQDENRKLLRNKKNWQKFAIIESIIILTIGIFIVR